jgi:hypothetical protein
LNKRVVPIWLAPEYGCLVMWPESAIVTGRQTEGVVALERGTHVAGPAKVLLRPAAPAMRLIAMYLTVLIFMMFRFVIHAAVLRRAFM